VAGLALARGQVFSGSTDGSVYARPVWAFTADGPVESQIAVAGRVAFVGSNGGQVYTLTR
jgi:hypothetical protein